MPFSQPGGNMHTRVKHVAWGVFLLSGTLLYSLDVQRSITQYNRRVWNTDNGLPQASILAVLQTRDGYLWIGTQEGLVRFDGTQFIVFEEAFTAGLAGNFINALSEDSAGGLWIGTLKGLSRYFKGRFQSFGRREGLPDLNITAIAAAPDGSVFVGTAAGLACWRDGRFHDYAPLSGLSDPGIEKICIDDAGRIWLGTRHGLYFCPTLRASQFVRHAACPEQRISGLCQDGQGRIWVGTDEGLFAIGKAAVQHYTHDDGLTSEDIQALLADRQGNLWIGTRTGGLNRLANGRFSALSSAQGFPDDWVCSLCADREGDLWVGASTCLVHLQDGKFLSIGTPEGLSHDVVFALHQGRDGALWIGTNRGLNRLLGGRISLYTTAQGLSNDVINAIHETPGGDVWVGTDAGLNRLHQGRFVRFPAWPALASLMIYSIWPDHAGGIWISTIKGAFYLKGSRLERYDSRNRLPGDHVNFVSIDRGGNTWFSVYGKGLVRMAKNGVMTVFTEKEGLASNMVNAVHEDKDGTLWFATMNGLSRFRDNRFSSLSKKQGLFQDTIFVILDDQRGNFWMSSNKGIFRMAKSDLQALADGRRQNARATLFGRKDGMRTAECNSSGLQVGIRDDAGRFWFATMKGAAGIDPQHLKPTRAVPAVTLEDFSVNGRPAATAGPLVLAAGSRDFVFHFTAPVLNDPEGLILRFKLEGYDQSWQTAGSERLTRYTNLPAGEYRFRVIAGNSDGNWNFSGIMLPFRIKRFFYQTPFFFVLCFLGLALSTVAAVYVRTRHLQKRERDLQRKIAERTAQLAKVNEELSTSNQSLAEQIGEREKFERQLEAANRQLQDTNRKLRDLDRQKTDFINITSHELRTPLTSVLGFASLIRRRINELFGSDHPLDEKKRQYNIEKIRESIEIIVTEGKRLTVLINDMLDIAKMEAGKMEWRHDRVQVEEIVRQALASTATLFRTKKLSVKSQCEENLPAISGDRDRLLQVLINLLSNAMKFTDRGTITIHARRIGDSISITVRDTGRGIDPADQPFIFQKFKQLGAASEEPPGSGLGLVICKEIVEHHGGSILVKSQPGQGTEFSIVLPTQS